MAVSLATSASDFIISYGTRLWLDWVVAGATKLTPGGRLILHTSVSIVDGQDYLRPHLEAALAGTGYSLWYHELDSEAPVLTGRI